MSQVRKSYCCEDFRKNYNRFILQDEHGMGEDARMVWEISDLYGDPEIEGEREQEWIEIEHCPWCGKKLCHK